MLSPKLCKLAPSGTGRGASGPSVVDEEVVVLPENVVVVDVVDVEDVDVVDEGIAVVVVVDVVDDRGTNVVVVVLEVMDGQGHPTILLH